MTSMTDALAHITRLGIDSAPLIYFIERHPIYIDRVRAILRQVDVGIIMGYSAVITLTEVLTQPLQVGNRVVEEEYRSYLLHSRNLTLIDITPPIADHAALLRARYRLRTPDALQIAAALAKGCEAFLTNDARLRRIQELQILVLDDLTL